MSNNVVTIASKQTDVYATIIRACLTGSKACLSLKDGNHYSEFMNILDWAQDEYDNAAFKQLRGE